MIQISPGFFYITNFGLDQESIDRQFAIGKELFNLPASEKLKYRADLENGGYNGYKPLGLREVRPGIQDNTEIYNIPKFIPELARPHPDIINKNTDEIEHFARHIHHSVVRKLLTLFAIVLELPDENYFHSRHRYDEAVSDCHLRYMKYHARDVATNDKLDNVWVKGHTDFGSLTLLFRQPVAALQVRDPSSGEGEGSWKWVKPHEGSITVTWKPQIGNPKRLTVPVSKFSTNKRGIIDSVGKDVSDGDKAHDVRYSTGTYACRNMAHNYQRWPYTRSASVVALRTKKSCMPHPGSSPVQALPARGSSSTRVMSVPIVDWAKYWFDELAV